MVKKIYYVLIGIIAIVCIVGILFATGTISTNEKVELNGVSFGLPPGFSVIENESTNKTVRIENKSVDFYLYSGDVKSLNITTKNSTNNKIIINGIEVNITETTINIENQYHISYIKNTTFTTNPSDTLHFTSFKIKTYNFIKDNKPFFVTFDHNIDNEEELLSYLLK